MKHGQLWSLDFLVSLVIFFLALFLLSTFAINRGTLGQSELEEMAGAALGASTLLMTEGIPANWTAATVVVPGILNATGSFDAAKWSELATLASTSPTLFKHALSSRFNLAISVTLTNGTPLGSIGALNGETIVAPVTRLALMDETPVRIEVIAWS